MSSIRIYMSGCIKRALFVVPLSVLWFRPANMVPTETVIFGLYELRLQLNLRVLTMDVESRHFNAADSIVPRLLNICMTSVDSYQLCRVC